MYLLFLIDICRYLDALTNINRHRCTYYYQTTERNTLGLKRNAAIASVVYA